MPDTFTDELIEARQRTWDEQKNLLKEIRERGTPETAEERQKIERMDADLDEKDKHIKDHVARETREREAATAREAYRGLINVDPTATHEDGGKEERSEFEKWLRGENRETRSFELDLTRVSQEKAAIRAGADAREVRDLLVGTTTAGGYTVPTGFMRRLYDFLEVYTGMRRTNATIITTASGENMDFPKVTAHGTAAIVGEGTALAEADPALGKLTLAPYKYGQLVQVSTELIQDSAVDILGFVAKDCARALARVTDTAYVVGSGTNAPQGVLIPMGTGATARTVATGVPGYADFVDLYYSVNEEYRQNGAQWLMRDAMVGSLRKLVDSQNRPLFQPSLVAGTPDTLFNAPIITDPNMGAIGTAASTIVAFGDFSAFYIRDVASIRFERSDEYAFANDLVTWRSILRTTSGLIDLTGAIKKMIEPTT